MEKKTSFSDLNLEDWIVRICRSLAVKNPTPVQIDCIPEILKSKDVIASSKTGSGKTLAFALPILQKLYEDPYGIFALVLTPTRELASQIIQQFKAIGKSFDSKYCLIIGRQEMIKQAQELSSRPFIVVATPGRLLAHLQGGETFNLRNLKFLVLDEADRMVNDQFQEQVDKILEYLPQKRQNLLFTATLTNSLEKLTNLVDKNNLFLYEGPKEAILTVDELKQHYLVCNPDLRDSYLVQTLREFRVSDPNGSIIIFVDTCEKCQVLSMTLNSLGYENLPLHSMISQYERLQALNTFKSSIVKILLATNLASRGLDIPTVQLVLNRNVPKEPKDYIHRVGRTARAGREGIAVTIMDLNEISALHKIEEHIKGKLTEYEIDEEKLVEISTQIEVMNTQNRIKIELSGFFEKKIINLRKQWLLEGLDPDKEEKKMLRKRKVTRDKMKLKVKRLKKKVDVNNVSST